LNLLGVYLNTSELFLRSKNGSLKKIRGVCERRRGYDFQFFPELFAYAPKTRALRAGTIIGSGTVSNSDQQHAHPCMFEIKIIETIYEDAPCTSFFWHD